MLGVLPMSACGRVRGLSCGRSCQRSQRPRELTCVDAGQGLGAEDCVSGLSVEALILPPAGPPGNREEWRVAGAQPTIPTRHPLATARDTATSAGTGRLATPLPPTGRTGEMLRAAVAAAVALIPGADAGSHRIVAARKRLHRGGASSESGGLSTSCRRRQRKGRASSTGSAPSASTTSQPSSAGLAQRRRVDSLGGIHARTAGLHRRGQLGRHEPPAAASQGL